MLGVLVLWLFGAWLALICAAWFAAGRWHIRARIATTIVDRALKNLLEGSKRQASVKHTPRGVSISSLLLSGEHLSRLAAGGIESRDAEDVAQEHSLLGLRDRRARLRVIEQLLWGRPPAQRGGARPGGPWLLGPLARATRGALARVQAATLQRGAALVARLVELDVRDISARYAQAGEPGPRPAVASHLEGVDALELGVRAVRLLPQAPARADADADDAEVAPDLGEADEPAASLWHAALTTLRVLWPRASVRPASTELTVTGVRLTLHTWPHTWTRARRKVRPAEDLPDAVGPRLSAEEVEALLARGAPETYVVLQQWEASVRVTVLPRQGWTAAPCAPRCEKARPSLAADARSGASTAAWPPPPDTERGPFAPPVPHEPVVSLDDEQGSDELTLYRLDGEGPGARPARPLQRQRSLGVLGPTESSEALETEAEDEARATAVPVASSVAGQLAYLNRGSLVPEMSTRISDSDRRAGRYSRRGGPDTRAPLEPSSPEHLNGHSAAPTQQQDGSVASAQMPGKASPFAAAADAETATGRARGRAPEPNVVGAYPERPEAAARAAASPIMRVTVDVQLKAFVPEFDAAGVALLSRIVERAVYLLRYAEYWEVRPTVGVAGHAAAWWRHAGGFFAAECAALSRHKAPLREVGERRARRLRHAALYAAVCASRPLYREPGARWWARPFASLARTFSHLGPGYREGTEEEEEREDREDANASDDDDDDDDGDARATSGHDRPATPGSAESAPRSRARTLFHLRGLGARAYAAPPRSSGRRGRGAQGGAAARLAALESRLSLEEAAHFRLATAATHNRRLAENPELLQFVADKVDAIVLHRGALGDGLQTLLLHEDQPSLVTGGADAGTSAQSTLFHPPVDLTFRLTCPKFGIAMEVGSAVCATSPTPGRAPPAAPYVCLALRGISLCLDACGGATLRAQDLACGEAVTPASYPEAKMLSCPSRVCRHTCKAAEFFRYAATGRVMSESAGADDGGAADCVHMVVSPRPGVGGAVVDGPPLPRGWTPREWVPGGSNVAVSVAAVGITYRERVIGALLDFADACEACKHAPWLWARYRERGGKKEGLGEGDEAADAGASVPTGTLVDDAGTPPASTTSPPHPSPWQPLQAPNKRLPMLPGRPPSLESMVLAMRAASGGAVASPLQLPTLGLEVRCPGIAAQLPYIHSLYLRHVDASGAGIDQDQSLFSIDEEDFVNGRSVSGKPPLTYRLTLTSQNLRLVVSSEDTGSLLSGGCARRVDATAFVDLFSYLSRESRTVVARHLMPQRAGLDVLVRPMSDESYRVAVAAMQERLREAEIVSMAKVWAYPEDMPAVLAGIKAQETAAAAAAAVRAAGAEASPRSPEPAPQEAPLPSARLSPLRPRRGAERASDTQEAPPRSPEGPDTPLPPGLLASQSILEYPLPLVPFVKVGQLRASLLERLEAAPSAPSGAALAVAGTVWGVQAWLSPLHLWHLISVDRTVRRMVLRFNASSLVSERRSRAEVADGQAGCARRAESSSKPGATPSRPAPRRGDAASAVAPALPSNAGAPFRRLAITVAIGQINALWMIGTWTSKDPGTSMADGMFLPRQVFRRHWGITVKRSDPAFIWAQWIAPIYSLAIADARAVLRLEDTREVAAGVSLEGVIVRDLQLPERAQHAYVLRPLPARARRMSQWIGSLRRRFLGIRQVPVSRMRWFVAVQAVMLARHARSQRSRTPAELLAVPPFYVMSLGALRMGPLFGPQVRFDFRRAAPRRAAPGAPPRASGAAEGAPPDEARLEVGQLLAYVRLKHQASIVVAAGQMAQIMASLSGRSSGKAAGGLRSASVPINRPSTTSQPRPPQRGLRLTVDVVGIDLLFRVQSRDLLSLKMHSGLVVAEKRSGSERLPNDIRLYVAASVQDLMVQDLRASTEHCMVLVPNGGAEYCSLDLAFTAHVDGAVAAPSLVVELQNPRVLLLFRFVADIMHAVDIMVEAARRTRAKAAARKRAIAAEAVRDEGAAAASAAADATRADPAPLPPVPSAAEVAAAQAADKLRAPARAALDADEIAAPRGAGVSERPGDNNDSSDAPQTTTPHTHTKASLPLKIILQLHNVGIILPTAGSARSVLGAHMEHVLLAVPGDVVPPSALEGIELPGLRAMVEESLLSTRTFRHSAFHDDPAADGARGREARPEPAPGAAQAGAGATGAPGPEPKAPGKRGRKRRGAASRNPSEARASSPGGTAGASAPDHASSEGEGDGSEPDESQLTFGDRIRRAAQDEALGSMPTRRNTGWRALQRQRRRALTHVPGVLYLDDAHGEGEVREAAGVLRIKPENVPGAAPAVVEPPARSAAEHTKQGLMKESSAGPARTKRAPSGPGAAPNVRLQADVDDRLAPPASPRPGTSCGGPGDAEDSPEPAPAEAAAPPPAQEEQVMTAAELERAAALQAAARRVTSTSVALSVESFHVVRGTLIKVPNQANFASAEDAARSGRGPGGFVPSSLLSFSWPSEVWDLVSGAPFLATCNVGLAMFRRPWDDVSQLHLSSTGLAFTLNSPNYTALMDFVRGNLDDLLNPPYGPPSAPGPAPVTLFNPARKFGPRLGERANFRMTVAVPRLTASLEAHAREWSCPGGGDFRPVTALDAPDLRPFLRLATSNVLLDFGKMDVGDKYIKVCATSLDVVDLRLAYRLEEIVALSSADEASHPTPASSERPASERGAGGLAAAAAAASPTRPVEGLPWVASYPELRNPLGTASSADAAPRGYINVRRGPQDEDEALPSPALSEPPRGPLRRPRTILETRASDQFAEDEAAGSPLAAEMSDALPTPQDSEWEATPGAGTWLSGGGRGEDDPPSLASYGSGDTPGSSARRRAALSPEASFGGFPATLGARGAPLESPADPFLHGSWATGRPQGAAPQTAPPAVPPLLTPAPTTGIKMSVARRLSEQADRRRSFRSVTPLPSARGVPRTPAALFTAPSERAGAAPAAPAGAPAEELPPIVDFVHVPELEVRGLSPEGAAVVCLVSAPAPRPPEAAAGSRAGSRAPPAAPSPGGNARVKLEVCYAQLADQTQAVDVTLSDCLFSWPYFDDLSLVYSLANLFAGAPGDKRGPEAGDAGAPTTALELELAKAECGAGIASPTAIAAKASPAVVEPRAWTYINAVVEDLTLFVPVFDVGRAQEVADALWAGAVFEEEEEAEFEAARGTPIPHSPSLAIGAPTGRSRFHALGDLALVSILLASLDEGLEAGVLPLEARGLVLCAQAARGGYAWGGDGETNVHADLRAFQAFVRDPGARERELVLPFTGTMTCDQVTPQIAEQEEVERLHRAAEVIQRRWLEYRDRQRRRSGLRSVRGEVGVMSGPAPRRTSSDLYYNDRQGTGLPALSGAQSEGTTTTTGPDLPSPGAKRLRTGRSGRGSPSASAGHANAPWKVVDDLIMDVATPRTRHLLQSYQRASTEHKELVYLQRMRSTTRTAVRVDLGALTARFAFSHVPFWRTAYDGVCRVRAIGADGRASGNADSQGGADGQTLSTGPNTSTTSCAPATPTTPDAARRDATLLPFRPRSVQVSGRMLSLTGVLCNDKPETFGAPDVLLASLAEVELGFDITLVLPDRPPNKAAQVSLHTSAAFLNSSTSRWEPIFEPWPLRLEGVDVVSPLYLSDRRTNLWISSDQHLDAAFNPASFMSIGDALAFYRELSAPLGSEGADATDFGSQAPSAVPQEGGGAAAVPPSRPPSAQGSARSSGSGPGAIMSLAPQKYLIQNQSGLRVYYCADGAHGGVRSPVYSLANGQSESLRVTPAPKRMQFGHSAARGGGTGMERVGATLHLHFEGNWMPLRDVAVNVVGKYRYRMLSPADNATIPVIVDIILVGRTKVITLHSGIWVENNIDRPISMRLHVPTTPLVPPSAHADAPGGRAEGGARPAHNGADVTVGPLAPGSGCYLPLTAVLGGLLFLNPEGFCEATRDVIRLSADLAVVLAQQGYIACDPDPAGPEEFPLHVALQTTPARLVSEFQAFKHMECTGPGLIQRAQTPLEVTLSIKPPLLLRNALPYELRVLVWQVYSPVVQLSRAQFSPRGKAEEAMRGMPWAGERHADGVTSRETSAVLEIPVARVREVTISTGGDGQDKTATDTFTPRLGLGLPQGLNRGRYFCYAIPAGASQGVYVDFRQTVLLHLSVEEIGMRSTKWALCSWIQRGGRPEAETQTLHRLPREIPLRMVDLDVLLPVSAGEDVGRYLVRLKEAALDLSVLHTRIARETRLAFNRHELEEALHRVARDVRHTLRRAGHPRAALRARRRERERRRATAARDPDRERRRKSRGTPIPARPDVAEGSDEEGDEGGSARRGRMYDRDDAAEIGFSGPSLLWRASGVTVESTDSGGLPYGSFSGKSGAAEPSGSSKTAPPRWRSNRALPVISEGQEPSPSPATSPAGPMTPPASPFDQPVTEFADVGLRQRFGSPKTAVDVREEVILEEEGAGAEASTPSPGARHSPPGAGKGVSKRAQSIFKRFSFRRLLRLNGRHAAGETRDDAASGDTPGSHATVPTPEKTLLPEVARDSGAPSPPPPPRVHISRYTPRSDSEGEAPMVVRTVAAGGSGTNGAHGVVELEMVDGGASASRAAGGDGASASARPDPHFMGHTRKASLAGDMLASVSAGSMPKITDGVPWWRRLPGTSGGAPEARERSVASKDRVRRFFERWRDAASMSTVERVSGTPSSTAPGPRAAQRRAPPLLLLGVHNSLVEAEAAGLPASGPCSMTLFVPYWLNNRTGVDLFTRDRASAPARSWLFGMALPWDHGEVYVPGTSMTAGLDVVDALEEDGLGLDALNATLRSSSVAGGRERGASEAPSLAAGTSAGDASSEGGGFLDASALLEFKLVLMNRQESLRFGLAHVAKRTYSPSIPVKTVGNKGAVELRGPAAPDEEVFGRHRRAAAGAARLAAQVATGAAGSVAGAVALPVNLARQVVSPREASHTVVEGSRRGADAAAGASGGGGAAFPSFMREGSGGEMSARESSRMDWGYAPGEIDAQRQGALRNLRRSSMREQQLLDVVPTGPGTRLVRVVQQPSGGATPPGGVSPRGERSPRAGSPRAPRSPRAGSPRAGSPLSRLASAPVEIADGAAPEPAMRRGASANIGGLTALVSGARRAARRLSEPPLSQLPEDQVAEEGPSRPGGASDSELPAYELPRRADAAVASAAVARGTVSAGRRHARTRSASLAEDVVPSLVRRSVSARARAPLASARPAPEPPADDGGPLPSPASADETAEALDNMRRAGLGGLPLEQQPPGAAAALASAGARSRRRTASSMSDSALLAADEAATPGGAALTPPTSRASVFLRPFASRRATAPAAADTSVATNTGGEGGERHAHFGGVSSSSAASHAPKPILGSQMSGPTFSDVVRAAVARGDEGSAEEARRLQEVELRRRAMLSISSGQRLYEFAVDVAAGPPESIYRHTKLVTLKPKYIIENQTGMPVRVKQLGTPDPGEWRAAANPRASFAHVLEPGARSAVYWDDVEKPRELVIQPLGADGREGEWGWSGGFPIPETEWYFGLRIRGARGRGARRYLNIPANVTVGGSGCVQVTLKALSSVPPYRIENRCKDVDLVFIQLPLVFRASSRSYIDRLAPGQVMPYAWDEPMLLNKLRVQARVVGRGSESRTADYAPDQLGDAPVLLLPTHGAGHAERLSAAEGKLSRTMSADVPDAVRQKLVSLLAAEFSKKVYVSVFADGPTRVLRFSDERNTSSLEQYHVILDLTARLKQVETQLREVSTSFARLNGMAGSHALDLYGRSASSVAPSRGKDPSTVHRASKRLPSSGMQAAAMRVAQTQRSQSFSAGAARARGLARTASSDALGGRAASSGGDTPRSPHELSDDFGLEREIALRERHRHRLQELSDEEGVEIRPGPIDDAPAARRTPTPDQAQDGARALPNPPAPGARTVRFNEEPTDEAGAEEGEEELVPTHAPASVPPTTDREERLRPYRRLIIETGSPATDEAPSERGAGRPGVLQVDTSALSAAMPRVTARPPVPRASASLPSLGRISSSRDWGHIPGGSGSFVTPSSTGRVRVSSFSEDAAKRAALGRSPSSSNVAAGAGAARPGRGGRRLRMGPDPASAPLRPPSPIEVPDAGLQRASVQASARRQDLLRGLSGPDARLLIGGDLTVTVVSAEGLYGLPRSTHAFARVHVRQPLGATASWEGASSSSIAFAAGHRVMRGLKKAPLPAPLMREVGARAHRRSTHRAGEFGQATTSVLVPGEEEMSGQTNVVWQSCDPVWEESLLFRDVCAVAELEVEIWDLGGSRNSEQLEKLVHSPQEVIKSCRFLGCAEVSLSETLDAPSGVSLWFPLMRRCASDHVSGELQLRFGWEVSARGLLSIKLNALERVLRQRAEILAALRPVPASTSETWAPTAQDGAASSGDASASGDKAEASGGKKADSATDTGTNTTTTTATPGTSVSSFVPGSFYGPGDEWIVQPSSVTAQVLVKHAHDVARRTLLIGVIEARGLEPRRGVVMALAASELPSPSVELGVRSAVAGVSARSETAPIRHTLAPRWDSERHSFARLDPADTVLSVRLWDCHGGLRHSKTLLGEAVVAAGHVKGEEPVYVWLGLRAPKQKGAHAPALAQNGSELQVCLRLQWQREVIRGMSVKVEASLAGAGLLVMGSLQDELFNVTLDDVRASAVQSHRELEFKGSIKKAQLDNQILDAVQPVVLAPAAKFGAGAESARSELIQLAFVRSFAGATSGEGLELVLDSPRGDAAAVEEDAFGSGRRGGFAPDDGPPAADRQSIKSFKRVTLSIGDLDLLTDEAFLEAVQAFFSSIPTADIWQDEAWQEQQRRLLAAQFGPREVESLAVNASIPSPLEDEMETSDAALDWVVDKETGDLAILHGQSDLSSWYFVEYAEISRVLINVTVSLTSRLLTGERALATRSVQSADAFHRSLSASGFQLVNVGNVPILLGRWVVGSNPSLRGGRFSNGFLSQRALQSNLLRHYRREALKEAHKVLSGAGPAIASVPLTVIWASGSAFSLLRAIGRGTTGPGAVAQQFVYVPLMSISMIISGFSRMLAAVLAAIPPGRVGGDSATVQRIIQRPTSALEALFRVGNELALGVSAGLTGLVLDPLAGWQARGWSGLGLGVAKAALGVLGRPLVGVLEALSQLAGASARIALGREGILGKLQRRIRAPGAAYNEDPLDALQDERATSEARVALRTLIAAWQRVLPQFFPAMAPDRVVDVINVRSTRVLLVTDRHLAYLRARHLRQHSIYRAKWLVPLSEVQNLTGSAETMKIQLTHVHRYDLWVLGVWPVAGRRRMRCASRMIYEQTVSKLSRLLQASKAGKSPASLGWDDSDAQLQARTADLTILSAPYAPPPPPAAKPAGGGLPKPTITEIT